MSTGRYATSVFCDDVRQEVGNKISYMGVYQGIMYIQSFPAVLPKFCVGIQAVTPQSHLFEFIKFKLLADDVVIAEQEVTGDLAKKFESAKENNKSITTNNDAVFTIKAILQLQPFAIEKPTKLTVRVENEGEELKAIGLHILEASS